MQLELALGDARVRIPWDGVSPRALTSAAQSRIFKAGAAKKHARSGFGTIQFELLHAATKGPSYGGAPLLVELPAQEVNVLFQRR